MNWQLLKNVNPPLDQPLMFYCPERNAVFFGQRQGTMLILGNTFSDGIRDGWHVKFEDYKELWGNKVYWTLFVKP